MQLLVSRTLFGIEAAIMMLAGVFDIIIGLSPNISTNFLLFHLSGGGSIVYGTIVGLIGLAGLVLSFTVRKPSQSKINAVYGIMGAFLLLMILEGSFGYFVGFLILSVFTAYLLWREVNHAAQASEEPPSPAPPLAPPAPEQSEHVPDTPIPAPVNEKEDDSGKLPTETT